MLDRSLPSESQLDSFYTAMVGMVGFIGEVQPDAVIFPLRGAYPFFGAYGILAGEQDASERSVLLPLGTCYFTNEGRVHGINSREKRHITRHWAAEHLAQHPSATRFMVIDEVVSGATISQHYGIIRSELELHRQGIEVSVAGIVDGRRNRKRLDRYGYLLDAAKSASFVTENLFTVDRSIFLPQLVNDGEYSFRLHSTPGLEHLFAYIAERRG